MLSITSIYLINQKSLGCCFFVRSKFQSFFLSIKIINFFCACIKDLNYSYG
uniref:Uncharacterized protein n=1 Tax=Lepeophtheirus salmonis TaxID=72036 RepID=A0A0K2TDD1_LEPSM